MLVPVTEYQIEWHPQHGARCRYKLQSEATWSGWLILESKDYVLVALLLSQQSVFYNEQMGTLCAGAVYAASTAASPTNQVAKWGPDAHPTPTPNIGDDESAARELGGGGMAVRQGTANAPWRTAQSLLVLLGQVNRQYPNRTKAYDGTIGDAAHQLTNSDHNPHVKDGDMGVVTAMDVTHDPTHQCDAGQLAQAIVASQDERVKYIIWNRHIVNSAAIGGKPAWTWREYDGPNPHDHHVHISVKADKAAYDSEEPWALPQVA